MTRLPDPLPAQLVVLADLAVRPAVHEVADDLLVDHVRALVGADRDGRLPPLDPDEVGAETVAAVASVASCLGRVPATRAQVEHGYQRLRRLREAPPAVSDPRVGRLVDVAWVLACAQTDRFGEARQAVAALAAGQVAGGDRVRLELASAFLAHQDLDDLDAEQHLRAAAAWLPSGSPADLRLQLQALAAAVTAARGDVTLQEASAQAFHRLTDDAVVAGLVELHRRLRAAGPGGGRASLGAGRAGLGVSRAAFDGASLALDVGPFAFGTDRLDDLACYEVVVAAAGPDTSPTLMLAVHAVGATLALRSGDHQRFDRILAQAQEVLAAAVAQPRADFVPWLGASIVRAIGVQRPAASFRSQYEAYARILAGDDVAESSLGIAVNTAMAVAAVGFDANLALTHAVTALRLERRYATVLPSSRDRILLAEAHAMARRTMVTAAAQLPDPRKLAEAIEVLRNQELPAAADDDGDGSLSRLVRAAVRADGPPLDESDEVVLLDPGPVRMPWGVALADLYATHPDPPDDVRVPR